MMRYLGSRMELFKLQKAFNQAEGYINYVTLTKSNFQNE